MSIVVNKDGSITRDGKTYKNRAEYSAAMKKKRAEDKKSPKPRWWEGKKAKDKRAEKESIAQGKRNKAATKKMYAAESMFKSARNRDDAKVKPGKARPFGTAFKSAKDAGKKTFLYKGKSYHTKTKSEMEAGSREKEKFERVGKSKKVPVNQSTLNKFKDSKTLSEFFGKIKKKK